MTEKECSYLQAFQQSPDIITIITLLEESIVNILKGILNPFKFEREFPCLFITIITMFAVSTLSVMKSKPEKSDELMSLFVITVTLISINLLARIKTYIFDRNYSEYMDYINEVSPETESESLKRANKRNRLPVVRFFNTLLLIFLLVAVSMNFYFIYTDQKSKTVDNFSSIGLGISILLFLLVYYKDVLFIIETLFSNLKRNVKSTQQVISVREEDTPDVFYNPEYGQDIYENSNDISDFGDYQGYNRISDEERERIAEISASSGVQGLLGSVTEASSDFNELVAPSSTPYREPVETPDVYFNPAFDQY